MEASASVFDGSSHQQQLSAGSPRVFGCWVWLLVFSPPPCLDACHSPPREVFWPSSYISFALHPSPIPSSPFSPQAADVAFHQMQEVILNSLKAVQSVMLNDKHCFELYGYDILFTSELKPILIEVNASPSLTANTLDDYKLKCDMLWSLLDIIDMEGKRTGQETQVRS